MATSKKEPLSSSRNSRATSRMSPNIRPSSSESSGLSGGYGARRARSVPSSPDRKFGSSSPSPAPAVGSSSDVKQHLSLSSAGRSVSSRTMSTSGSSGSRAQLFPGSASKPMLARAKSDKISITSHRPPVLAVPPSNSFKDMSKTAPKASPSSLLLRNKLSPKPSADGSKATSSPKPSGQRVVPQGEGATRGRIQPVSTARPSGVAAKKRLDGATVSSKAKGVSPRTPVTRMEKEDDASTQFNKTESLISAPATEEMLHEHLTDSVDLKSTDVAVPDQCEPSSNQPELQVKDGEEVKGHSCEGKLDAGGNELCNGGQDANSGINKIVDESGHTEREVNGILDMAVPPPNMTELDQMQKEDDPKGNDAIEEAKRKLMEERKSRVKALVGAFERVMSLKE